MLSQSLPIETTILTLDGPDDDHAVDKEVETSFIRGGDGLMNGDFHFNRNSYKRAIHTNDYDDEITPPVSPLFEHSTTNRKAFSAEHISHKYVYK